MKKKKTVNIKWLVEEINRKNRESTCPRDVRNGWNSLLETIMMQANVYNGHSFLKADEVPAGHLPGIVRDGEKNLILPDDSRRVYFIRE